MEDVCGPKSGKEFMKNEKKATITETNRCNAEI